MQLIVPAQTYAPSLDAAMKNRVGRIQHDICIVALILFSGYHGYLDIMQGSLVSSAFITAMGVQQKHGCTRVYVYLPKDR